MKAPHYCQRRNDSSAMSRPEANTPVILRRKWGNSGQPLKKPTKGRLSLRRDQFHSRVGNAFPNCQQPYKKAQLIKSALTGQGTGGFL